MRFLYKDFGLDFETDENCIDVISLESAAFFSEFFLELLTAERGEESHIILSECDKEINFARSAEIITDPYQLNLNNRKMLSQLYKNTDEIVSQRYAVEKIEALCSLQKIFEEVSEKLDYPVAYDENLDFSAILKAFDFRFDDTSFENPLSRTLQYMKLSRDLLGTKIFFLVRMKDWFPVEKLRAFYENVLYSKIQLILVERHSYERTEEERNYVIDKDRWLIYY